MALINCPECQRQVSDSAYSCPQCGYPISGRQEAKQTSDGTQPLQAGPSKDAKLSHEEKKRIRQDEKERIRTRDWADLKGQAVGCLIVIIIIFVLLFLFSPAFRR